MCMRFNYIKLLQKLSKIKSVEGPLQIPVVIATGTIYVQFSAWRIYINKSYTYRALFLANLYSRLPPECKNEEGSLIKKQQKIICLVRYDARFRTIRRVYRTSQHINTKTAGDSHPRT